MIDPTSQTWLALDKGLRKHIEDAHAALEAPGLPVAETENLRGRIAAYRQILSLGQPQPELSGSGVIT